MKITLGVTIAVMLIGLPGIASADSAPAALVHLKNFAYQPTPLVVHVGESVTFVNDDDEAHTVTSTDKLPDFRSYAVDVPLPGRSLAPPTAVMAEFLRDTMRANMTNFRVFGPDETASNKNSMKRPRKLGSRVTFPKTPTAGNSRRTAASWKCLARRPSRVGSRVTS